MLEVVQDVLLKLRKLGPDRGLATPGIKANQGVESAGPLETVEEASYPASLARREAEENANPARPNLLQ